MWRGITVLMSVVAVVYSASVSLEKREPGDVELAGAGPIAVDPNKCDPADHNENCGEGTSIPGTWLEIYNFVQP